MNCSPEQIKLRSQIRRMTGEKSVIHMIDKYNISAQTLKIIVKQLPAPGKAGYVEPCTGWRTKHKVGS